MPAPGPPIDHAIGMWISRQTGQSASRLRDLSVGARRDRLAPTATRRESALSRWGMSRWSSATGACAPCTRRGGRMTMTWKVLLLLSAAAVACAAAAMGSAGVSTVAPLTLASGPSPFAGCTAGDAPGSVLYPNAEEE